MPRTLPWLQGGTSKVTAPKPAPVKTKRPAKRSRHEDSQNEEESGEDKKQAKGKDRARTPSTSPPPEPPDERFMIEGMKHDDKYRMVEDELLSIAKHFTVHLHAAEYQRQEKLAKTKNADVISSILRPVTQKLPDQTKRKLDSVERSKTQRTTLQNLLGKQAFKDDLSDEEGDALPYIGTSLHGLMDSPRKRVHSLARLGSMNSSTRAAAGFNKPAINSSQQSRNPFNSSPPQAPKPFSSGSFSTTMEQNQSDTESSDGDDDLDDPIPAPKLISSTTSKVIISTDELKTRMPPKRRPGLPSVQGSAVREKSTSASMKMPVHDREAPQRVPAPARAPRDVSDPLKSSTSLSRIRKRLAQAREQKESKEKEEQKRIAGVPTFL